MKIKNTKKKTKELSKWLEETRKFQREKPNPYVRKACEENKSDLIEETGRFNKKEAFFKHLAQIFFDRFSSNIVDWSEDQEIIFDYVNKMHLKYVSIDIQVVLTTMHNLEDQLRSLKYDSQHSQ